MRIERKNFGLIACGMKVAISDGTKMPPKHHVKKLREWRYRNTEGYVWGVDEETCTVEVVATKRELDRSAKVRVRMINRFSLCRGFKITLLDAE
ncbi:hypothetical protein ACP3V3_19845 [Vibrio sp. PNB22_3_1]